MATEIERKYLVRTGVWQIPEGGTRIRQGYLVRAPERTVRVRTQGNQGTRARGFSRLEVEAEISLADAETLLNTLCEGALIEKTRHHLVVQGHVWEVDVFHGENAGLVLAEIELTDENEAFQEPAWIGREVNQDVRYYNAYLVAHPFTSWEPQDQHAT